MTAAGQADTVDIDGLEPSDLTPSGTTSGAQPPMTATTKKGELIGLDIDIAKAMADALGVKIKFVSMPFLTGSKESQVITPFHVSSHNASIRTELVCFFNSIISRNVNFP